MKFANIIFWNKWVVIINIIFKISIGVTHLNSNMNSESMRAFIWIKEIVAWLISPMYQKWDLSTRGKWKKYKHNHLCGCWDSSPGLYGHNVEFLPLNYSHFCLFSIKHYISPKQIVCLKPQILTPLILQALHQLIRPKMKFSTFFTEISCFKRQWNEKGWQNVDKRNIHKFHQISEKFHQISEKFQ